MALGYAMRQKLPNFRLRPRTCLCIFPRTPLTRPFRPFHACFFQRIPAGNFGKAWRNGVAEFLLPGRHVVNDALFEFAEVVSISEPTINHGTCSIVTIPGNKIGKCIVNGKATGLSQVGTSSIIRSSSSSAPI